LRMESARRRGIFSWGDLTIPRVVYRKNIRSFDG
jgi:hypothetical protein